MSDIENKFSALCPKVLTKKEVLDLKVYFTVRYGGLLGEIKKKYAIEKFGDGPIPTNEYQDSEIHKLLNELDMVVCLVLNNFHFTLIDKCERGDKE